MEYACLYTRDPELDPVLFSCPFQLFLNDNKWELHKRLSRIIDKKIINIQFKIFEYATVGELLLDFLEDRQWFCNLSAEVKERLIENIEQIYFFESPYDKGFTYIQKFKLIQQFTRRENRNVRVITPPIEIALCDAAKEASVPEPETYADALQVASKLKFRIPEHDILEFENGDHLCFWVLEYLAEHNKVIGRCKTCKRYYIKEHSNSKYCGTECYKKRDRSGAFLGESQIQLSYKRIHQWFSRKCKSKSSYIYISENFPEIYDTAELFSGFKHHEDFDPTDFIFVAEDFVLIKNAYKCAYQKSYDRLIIANRALSEGAITDEQYQDELKSFLLWLDNVVKQLSCFCIY